MGDVLMQDGTKPLDRVEMWVIGRKLDQMDTAGYPGHKGPEIGPFMVSALSQMT